MDPKLVMAVLGPLFLVLGTWRLVQHRRLTPQARTWLLVGAIFSAVAVWLWTQHPAGASLAGMTFVDCSRMTETG